MPEKLLSMAEAIERFVPSGASVALGCALEPLIPFAAGHELIRQRRRDLTLIGPISDILFDQLIGAGCVRAHHRGVGRQRQRGAGPQLSSRRRAGPVPHRDHSRGPQQLQRLAGAAGWRARRAVHPNALAARQRHRPRSSDAFARLPRRWMAPQHCSCQRCGPTWPSCTSSEPTTRDARMSGAGWASARRPRWRRMA